LEVQKWIERALEIDDDTPFIRMPLISTDMETQCANGKDRPRIERAKEKWHNVAGGPHEDNRNFFLLGVSLAKSGCYNSEISPILNEEAAWARTPRDRRRQNPSIINSIFGSSTNHNMFSKTNQQNSLADAFSEE
jgi:hypothetical protein